jgi:lipoprotein-releasing system ATP-binding protein
MLEAFNLSKNYGNIAVVRNVSLQVQKSEIVSIMGPSGAGKSTLLHLVGGLDKPDSGKVILDGSEFLALPAKKQARFRNDHIGFVFQFHHLLPEFSAAENVAIPLWIKGTGRKEGLRRAGQLLDIVGLSGRMEHKPTEMSGGEQQRVAIARALVNEPSVVMADEPTGNLDTANAHAVHELFLSLRDSLKQTFIIVTHNDALAAMTDRTLLMRDGSIVDEQFNR